KFAVRLPELNGAGAPDEKKTARCARGIAASEFDQLRTRAKRHDSTRTGQDPMNTTPVYTTAEIRAIESLVLTAPDAPDLMEKAGLAAAEIAKTKLLTGNGNRILVLAGPGNNGGDALVTARHLYSWGIQVTLVFTGEAGRLSPDAKQALEQWLSTGGSVNPTIPAGMQWDGVIDGLFGIGLSETRRLEEKYRQLIRYINDLNLPVLALDIPSGLHSDSGHVQDIAI